MRVKGDYQRQKLLTSQASLRRESLENRLRLERKGTLKIAIGYLIIADLLLSAAVFSLFGILKCYF
jgi:hypothetical protein